MGRSERRYAERLLVSNRYNSHRKAEAGRPLYLGNQVLSQMAVNKLGSLRNEFKGKEKHFSLGNVKTETSGVRSE